jgi:hypothetical protein
MSNDVPDPLLDPLSDLYDAQTNLSTWVTAVKLQRERLRENITKARTRPGRVVPNDEVWSWLLRQVADALMFVLAIDQVCDAARAVRHRAPADAIPEIDEALASGVREDELIVADYTIAAVFTWADLLAHSDIHVFSKARFEKS